MILNNRPIISPGRPISTLQSTQKPNIQNSQSNFGTVLKEKLEAKDGVKISKHADLRLKSRNIQLNSKQMERIKNGVDKAEEKGVKDSLILVDSVALVVNIKNKTIITAAGRDDLKENVFTNIDGAVIV